MPSPGRSLGTCLLTRDAATFDLGDFEREGVPCALSVARSVPKRQAEFLHGRLAVRGAFRALGVEPVDVPIGATREPVWPDGFLGSITHCEGLAAAAVAHTAGTRGIGIDVERVVTPDWRDDLFAMAIGAREQSLIEAAANAPGARQPVDVLATMVFSAKESLFKAAHACVGRFFDFDAARVIGICRGTGVVTLEVTEPLSTDFHPGRRCHVDACLVQPNAVLTFYAW